MDKRIRLVLASASPRRRQLLKKVGIPFRVLPSHVSEKTSEKNPVRLVEELALRKAVSTARLLQRRSGSKRRSEPKRRSSPERRKDLNGVHESERRFEPERRSVVLGADTIVVLHGKILGKPRDAKDAYRMLYRLSGSLHQVYTGVAVVNAETGQSLVTHAKSEVRMKKIPLEMLLKLSRKHLDKAGSYAIQEKRDPIARVVKGSYDNVVGLPVATVKALLKKLSRDV